MDLLEDKRAICEEWTLSNFKMWSFIALEDFNNYGTIITNNDESMRKSCEDWFYLYF